MFARNPLFRSHPISKAVAASVSTLAFSLVCAALGCLTCIGPAQAQPADILHPGWDVVNLRPAGFQAQISGMAFLSNGDLAVTHWGGTHANVDQPQMNGILYILKNVVGDKPVPAATVFADKLEDPVGLAVVDDRFYVSGGQTFKEILDTNKDGKADGIRTIATMPGTHARHEFLFGVLYKDGKFWINASSSIPSGATSPDFQKNKDRGTVLAVDPATGKYDIFAMGLREPNGIGTGPDSELFIPDVQGNWLPSNKLINVRKGRFYGFHHTPAETWENLPESPPAVHVPQGEVARALGNPLYVDKGLYAGQLLMGDVAVGGIRRFFLEKINGEFQGCVFNFTLGLESGVERLIWGPDGMLYVGGCGQGSGWSFKQDYGLQKLKPNGKPVFEMLAVRSRPTGMEIEFTEPVGAAASVATNYTVRTWWYKPTIDYGGNPQDTKTLPVKSVLVSPDQKKVFLEIPGLVANRVVDIKLSATFTSQAGRDAWTKEAWYTLNAFGSGNPFDPASDIFARKIADTRWAQGVRIVYNQGNIQVHVTGRERHAVEVRDVRGLRLAARNGAGEAEYAIATAGWAAGVYMVRVSADRETAGSGAGEGAADGSASVRSVAQSIVIP